MAGPAGIRGGRRRAGGRDVDELGRVALAEDERAMLALGRAEAQWAFFSSADSQAAVEREVDVHVAGVLVFHRGGRGRGRLRLASAAAGREQKTGDERREALRLHAARSFSRQSASRARRRATRSPIGGCVENIAASSTGSNGFTM
jgi:hypothetical protein